MKKQADAARLAAANEAGPRVEVYHKTWCSYSRAALALLREKGVRFEDIDVTDDEIREREMIERAQATSVPQIFVDGECPSAVIANWRRWTPTASSTGFWAGVINCPG